MPNKQNKTGSYSGSTGTERIAIILFRGGIFFTIVVLLWAILMTASEVSGSVEEQLRQISEAPGLFRRASAKPALLATH